MAPRGGAGGRRGVGHHDRGARRCGPGAGGERGAVRGVVRVRGGAAAAPRHRGRQAAPRAGFGDPCPGDTGEDPGTPGTQAAPGSAAGGHPGARAHRFGADAARPPGQGPPDRRPGARPRRASPGRCAPQGRRAAPGSRAAGARPVAVGGQVTRQDVLARPVAVGQRAAPGRPGAPGQPRLPVRRGRGRPRGVVSQQNPSWRGRPCQRLGERRQRLLQCRGVLRHRADGRPDRPDRGDAHQHRHDHLGQRVRAWVAGVPGSTRPGRARR